MAVIGLGVLGLATVAVAALAGGQVYAVSGRQEAIEKAFRLGAKEALSKSGRTLAESIEKQTGGTGLDFLVTTSNNWQDWLLALQLVRRGGTIVVIGFPGRGKDKPGFNPLAPEYFYQKQLNIISAGMTPDYDLPSYDLRFTIKRNMGYLLDLIMRGQLNPGELITDVVPAYEIESVYQRIVNREPGFVTAALKW